MIVQLKLHLKAHDIRLHSKYLSSGSNAWKEAKKNQSDHWLRKRCKLQAFTVSIRFSVKTFWRCTSWVRLTFFLLRKPLSVWYLILCITLQAAGAYRFRKMGAFDSNHGIRSFVDGGEISACIWQGDLRCLVRLSSSSVTRDVGRLLW